MSEKIAERYAQALMELKNYEEISSDLKAVEQVLLQNSDFLTVLNSPSFGQDEKKALLDEVFTPYLGEKTMNFLKVLIENSRFASFHEVLKAYFKKLDVFNNIVNVEVTSAVELNENLKNKLNKKLEQKLEKNIRFEFKVDSSILAGLVIKIGDKIIDTSLKTRLEQFEKQVI